MLKHKAVPWSKSSCKWWVLVWNLLVWLYCSFHCREWESKAMSGTHVMQNIFLINGKGGDVLLWYDRKVVAHRMGNLRSVLCKGTIRAPSQIGRGLSKGAEPGMWSLARAGSVLMIDELGHDHGEVRPCWALHVGRWGQWKLMPCFMEGELPSLISKQCVQTYPGGLLQKFFVNSC